MACFLLMGAAFLHLGSALPTNSLGFPSETKLQENQKFLADLEAQFRNVLLARNSIDIQRQEGDPNEELYSNEKTKMAGLGQSIIEESENSTSLLNGQKHEMPSGFNIQNQTASGNANQEDGESTSEINNQNDGDFSTTVFYHGNNESFNTTDNQGIDKSSTETYNQEYNSLPSSYDNQNDKVPSTEIDQEESMTDEATGSPYGDKNIPSPETDQGGTDSKEETGYKPGDNTSQSTETDQDKIEIEEETDDTPGGNDNQPHEADKEGTGSDEGTDDTVGGNDNQPHEADKEGTESGEETDDTVGGSKKLVVLVKVVWEQGRGLQNDGDSEGQPWRDHEGDLKRHGDKKGWKTEK